MTKDEFKAIRTERLGMTQIDLAVALGTTQPTVSQIESGDRGVSAGMAARIEVLAAKKGVKP